MFYFFFFFKQKTAYDMRISDWSSDVCSSDLRQRFRRLRGVVRDPAAIDDHRAAIVLHQRRPHMITGCVVVALVVEQQLSRVVAVSTRNGTLDLVFARHMAGAARSRRDAACLLVSRSEEPTSELQSLLRISYPVYC